MKKTIQATGKRKRAIARAVLREGNGVIRINNKRVEIYEPEFSRLKIMEPLLIAGEVAKKVNIDVNVFGGGFQSQTEAARLAIAKSLVEFSGSKQLKKDFLDYDRHLLVADTRKAEASKPNDSKPRAKRQKSYR